MNEEFSMHLPHQEEPVWFAFDDVEKLKKKIARANETNKLASLKAASKAGFIDMRVNKAANLISSIFGFG